jgi:HSP20 family protein
MASVSGMAVASSAVVLATVVTMACLAAPATALVPYGPWDLLDDPFRVLEQSPVAASAPRPGSAGEAGAGVVLARCDWKETPEAHVISVDVPGVRREDVRVEVEESGRVLRVSSERRADEEKDGERWHRADRAAGRFWRRFRMPAGADDVDRVSARLDNGGGSRALSASPVRTATAMTAPRSRRPGPRCEHACDAQYRQNTDTVHIRNASSYCIRIAMADVCVFVVSSHDFCLHFCVF